jgi:hypothetical protein
MPLFELTKDGLEKKPASGFAKLGIQERHLETPVSARRVGP